MTANDASVLDAAALAAEFAEDLIVGTVRDVHGAVAGRVHGVTAKVAGGTTIGQRVHDGVSKVVYTSISASLKASAKGLKVAGEAGIGAELEASPRGRFVRAAIAGLIGDRLRDEGSRFHFDLGVRVGGRDVVLDRDGVAAAYPNATDTLVVFVHGLSENEAYWNRAARPRTEERREHPERRSYGERLEGEGWTPVMVRVNTGLPIAENGVALAAVLDRLVEAWPVDVRRIALVGHSMGGLILRAACAVSTDSEKPWTDRVTDVICLGTPHLGAPLERVVTKGVAAMGRLPEAAPFGRILEYRSTGILDLRHGLASDVQNLPNARYRLVAATLTRSPRSVTSSTIGDYLVPYDSALGRRKGGEEMFPGAETLHVPLADHFDLLNHDDIYAAIREWLQDRSDPPTKEESPTG
ncbi:MAG: alpha/beta hydrolase [Marmoricola sp.]|nr:alpha/beta hydrolase [Marmoricola sp.]